jgi:hypothetical protein
MTDGIVIRKPARAIVFLAVSAILLASTVSAQQQQQQPSQNDLAQANNPLANFVAFNVQNYWIPELYGLPDETANTMWLRGVVPVDRWIIRASAPVATVPSPDPAALDSVSGLGDINAFAAYVLTRPEATRMIGVGPLLAAPTATDDALGSGKWQGGAAAVVFDFSSPTVQWGSLLTWQTSIAGDDDRDDTNLLVFQPFLLFQLGKGTYLRSTSIWVYDLEQSTYNMPIGLGVGKVLVSKNTIYNLFVEPQFTFLHRGVGQPALQIFAGINFQFK